MFQALYRKYRPTVFDDVYGQEHITSVLKHQTENGRVSHAYLFCGSRGTGKTTCAKILAKAVNCESLRGGNPCGVCASCRAIDSATATDVLEMDAASNNGVDYIRDIRDEVSYTPAMLKRRVYIIDEVHMLSTSAFNALLKTLEEPPEHVVFILATTEMHKLPTTIISRCQRFDFRRISIPVLSKRLHYIADTEHILLEKEAAQRIARQAQGGMRDAISLFELCSGGGADVTLARTEEILGLSGYDFLHNAVSHLACGDVRTMFSVIADAVNSSKDIMVFWQELTSFYRDMMVSKYAADPADYLDLTEQETALLTDAATKFNIPTLTYHCCILDEAMQSMQRTPQMKRTIAEFAVLRMCDPVLDTSVDALAARIAQLEDRLAMLEIGVTPVAKQVPVPATSEAAKITEPELVNAAEQSFSTVETDADYTVLFDTADLMEKIGQTDKRVQSFLADAVIAVSHDRKKVRIRTGNQFASRMLSDPAARSSIARALALCRITDSTTDITVETAEKKATDDAAAEDLYSQL